MNKLDIAKNVVKIVVCAGTTKIVSGIIANNTDPTKITDKVAIVSASFVLGSMAADAASKYTNAKIDELAEWYETNIKDRFNKELAS